MTLEEQVPCGVRGCAMQRCRMLHDPSPRWAPGLLRLIQPDSGHLRTCRAQVPSIPLPLKGARGNNTTPRSRHAAHGSAGVPAGWLGGVPRRGPWCGGEERAFRESRAGETPPGQPAGRRRSDCLPTCTFVATDTRRQTGLSVLHGFPSRRLSFGALASPPAGVAASRAATLVRSPEVKFSRERAGWKPALRPAGEPAPRWPASSRRALTASASTARLPHPLTRAACRRSPRTFGDSARRRRIRG
jgi:hypothetical protein